MTETVRARCQNPLEMRTDGMAPPTRFGEVIAADHTVLSENNVSRLQHRYAVVVQKCTLRIGLQVIQPGIKSPTTPGKVCKQFLPLSQEARNN